MLAKTLVFQKLPQFSYFARLQNLEKHPLSSIIKVSTIGWLGPVQNMHDNFQNLFFCNAFDLNDGKKLWST